MKILSKVITYFENNLWFELGIEIFVKTNFLTRSTSGPPHILSLLLNHETDFFFKILSKNFFGGQMSATSFLESSMKVNIEYRFSINSFRMGKMHRGQQTCMILSNIFISHSEHYCLILSKNYQDFYPIQGAIWAEAQITVPGS